MRTNDSGANSPAISMTTGGGIEAKRPSFIVSLHNVMERYVQRHSKTLAWHQVRSLPYRS